MKRILNWLLFFCLITLGINSIGQVNHKKNTDITLYISSSIQVDSVLFCNITQDREFQFKRYADTLELKLKDSINDLYDLTFFTKAGKIRANKLWLDGNKIIIKARLLTNKFEIDTVIGSRLYYIADNFYKELNGLWKQKADSLLRESFLLETVRINIENPFSIEAARNYFVMNQSNKQKLSILYDVLKLQNTTLQNHQLNVFKKIEKILSVAKVNLENYDFKNTANKQAKLTFTKGNTYMLDFWFTNCVPCIKDHILIKDSLSLLEAKNTELIGISIDQDFNQWTKYLKKNKYKWPNLLEQDNGNRLTQYLSINSFPTYIVINDSGSILFRTSNLIQLLGFIRNNLN